MTNTELSVCLTSVTHFLDYNFLYLVSLYPFSFSFILFFSLLYQYFISFLSFLFPTNFFSSTNKKRFRSEQIFRMPMSLHLVLQVQSVGVCVYDVSVCFRSFYYKEI